MKRALSLLFACILWMGAFSAGSAAFAEDTAYKNGDVVEFGSYPQTQVTDEETIDVLNGMQQQWKSYGYYSRAYGNEPDYDPDYSMLQSDYMQYTDVSLGGTKYRGVRFRAYRPDISVDGTDTNGSYLGPEMYLNGFECDTVYWFEWKPIRWIVLNAQSGLVFAQNVVDAQAFNPYYHISPDDGVWYCDKTCTEYASAYASSFIRHWLTDRERENGFASEAFSDYQWSCIRSARIDNHAVKEEYLPYAGEDTVDRVYLMSAYEVNGTTCADCPVYECDPAKWNIQQRDAPATDYARCQGVKCSTVSGQFMGVWITRTIGRRYLGSKNGQAYYAPSCVECWNSVSMTGTRVDRTSGIRPALHIDPALLQTGDLTAPPTSGACGDNVQWAFDKQSGVLSLSGTGDMDSYGSFASYGYSAWQDDIRFVVAANGVKSIGAHAFEGCPYLEEVILGEDTGIIGKSAFGGCPCLVNVTLLSQNILASGAFPANNRELTIICSDQNIAAIRLCRTLGAQLVTFRTSDRTLSFGGTITVHDAFSYVYLPTLVQRYGDAEKICFNRLVFADIPAQGVPRQDYIRPDAPRLTMQDVEVSLVCIDPEGNRENTTYARMAELLESGDYSAFRLHIVSDNGAVDRDELLEENIEEKLERVFPNMPKKVLRLVSRAINFIMSIFRKR